MNRAPILALLLLLPHAANAQLSTEQKVKCANAYEQAQRTRNDGHFRASREQTLICADDACPKVLRDECVKWLGELDVAMPTVLFVARDTNGNELSDVAVTVDGEKLVDRLDGKAHPVDPGTRTFRFVRNDGESLEQKVLIREGEKRRVVTVIFPGAAVPEKPPPPSGGSSVPATTWILGGLGAVALGVSVPMYASYFRQKSDLDDSACAKTSTCNPDDVAPVKRQLIYANVTSAIGAVALGAAIVIWVASPSPKANVSAGLAPMPGGLSGAFRVTF